MEHAEEANPQHKVKSALNLHPTDLNQYGIGVVLYFTFMKFLAFSFMWLAVLCMPPSSSTWVAAAGSRRIRRCSSSKVRRWVTSGGSTNGSAGVWVITRRTRRPPSGWRLRPGELPGR